MESLLDESRFIRLGSGVDSSGSLNSERMAAAVSAIRELDEKSRELGAGNPLAVATSAVRDAGNGEAFATEVRRKTGVELEIISGEREAYLTFLGATMGIDIGTGVLICDIGGGSSELISADGEGIRWERSLRAGSGRMTERFVNADPPTHEERSQIADCVQTLLNELPDVSPTRTVFTGGTASHVAWLSGDSGAEVALTLEKLLDVESVVYGSTAPEIARRFNIRPERAQVLPAGVTVLRVIARWSGAGQVHITRHGIREGVILDAVQREGALSSPM